MMSPYRMRRTLLAEIAQMDQPQRKWFAGECLAALHEADQPQPVVKWRWHFNLIDKAFLVWIVLLTGMILFAQQPGGLAYSLRWENIGEWGHLYFIIVAIPWAILRLLGRLGRGY